VRRGVAVVVLVLALGACADDASTDVAAGDDDEAASTTTSETTVVGTTTTETTSVATTTETTVEPTTTSTTATTTPASSNGPAPVTLDLEETDAGWHVVAGDEDGALTSVVVTWDRGDETELTHELGRSCPEGSSAMDVVLPHDGRDAVSAVATSYGCEGDGEQRATWPS